MITVNLMGRLGNNLFQIAAGLSLAHRHETDCYYINHFDYLNAFELKDIKQTTNSCNSTFYEKTFNFNENFLKLGNNIHLHGYFQSYKYFLNAEEKIKSNFTFKQFVKDNVWKNGYSYLEQENNVTAIHVRRTDYLSVQHVHPICSMEYYTDSLLRIGKTDKVLVFSDDVVWCRQNFDLNYEIVDMDLHCSMYMMSKVKNIIIANSTFSWWSAWLNNTPNKQVYAPKQWFGNTLPYKNADINLETCTKDLFLPEWNVL
jgi:hypothetical protein